MKYLVIVSLLATSLLTSACNTWKGLGKDVERGGEKIQRSAEPGPSKY